MTNYLAIVLLTVLNVLLLVNSLEVDIFSTVNGFRQNTYRNGDNLELTCVINITTADGDFNRAEFMQPAQVFYSTDKSDEPKVNITGVSHIDSVRVDGKTGVTIKLINVTDTLPPFKCQIFTNKSTVLSEQWDVKYWKADIDGSEAVTIHGADPKNEIKEFKKNDMVMIGCNEVKVKDPKQGTIDHVILLKDDKSLVEFRLDSTGVWSKYTDYEASGMKKDEYKVETNKTLIHIDSAKEEVKGNYACQYIAAFDSTFYKSISPKFELKFNSGLRLNFSFILIIISFISVLFSNSK